MASPGSSGRGSHTRAQQLLRWATVPEQSGPKWGCCVPFRRELGPHVTIPPGPRPTSVYNKWYSDRSSRLATIDMGRKVGGGCCAPFRGGGAGSPSNTMSPGPRPTSVPSGIFIHPTIWPQYTYVTDRQTAQRSPSHMANRTKLLSDFVQL